MYFLFVNADNSGVGTTYYRFYYYKLHYQLCRHPSDAAHPPNAAQQSLPMVVKQESRPLVPTLVKQRPELPSLKPRRSVPLTTPRRCADHREPSTFRQPHSECSSPVVEEHHCRLAAPDALNPASHLFARTDTASFQFLRPVGSQLAHLLSRAAGLRSTAAITGL